MPLSTCLNFLQKVSTLQHHLGKPTNSLSDYSPKNFILRNNWIHCEMISNEEHTKLILLCRFLHIPKVKSLLFVSRKISKWASCFLERYDCSKTKWDTKNEESELLTHNHSHNIAGLWTLSPQTLILLTASSTMVFLSLLRRFRPLPSSSTSTEPRNMRRNIVPAGRCKSVRTLLLLTTVKPAPPAPACPGPGHCPASIRESWSSTSQYGVGYAPRPRAPCELLPELLLLVALLLGWSWGVSSVPCKCATPSAQGEKKQTTKPDDRPSEEGKGIVWNHNPQHRSLESPWARRVLERLQFCHLWQPHNSLLVVT